MMINRLVKKGDLSIFENAMTSHSRWADLSILQTTEILAFSHTTMFFKGWCDNECMVDLRGQMHCNLKEHQQVERCKST